MAASIASLNIDVTARTAAFIRGIKGAEDRTKAFTGSVKGMGGIVEGAFGSLQGKLAGLVGAGGILGGIGLSLKFAADAEKTATSFRVLIGDATEANKVLADLRKFGAETPFEFPELADASKKLLAFGVSTDSLLPTLRRLGDVSAGLDIPIGELAEIYGKARVQGRLFAEDVNQLVGRGIPVIQEFAKQFGVTDDEVKKLVEDGKIGFSNLEQAFISLTSEGGKFSGLMAAQSQTLSGQISTLKDNVKGLATEFGEALLPTIKMVTADAGLAFNAFNLLRTELSSTNAESKALNETLGTTFTPVTSALTWVLDVTDAVKQSWLGWKLIIAEVKAIALESLALIVSEADLLAKRLKRATGGRIDIDFGDTSGLLDAANVAGHAADKMEQEFLEFTSQEGLGEAFRRQLAAARAGATGPAGAGAAGGPVAAAMSTAEKQASEIRKFWDRLRGDTMTPLEKFAHDYQVLLAGLEETGDVETFSRAVERLRTGAEELLKAEIPQVGPTAAIERHTTAAVSLQAQIEANKGRDAELKIHTEWLKRIEAALRAGPVIRESRF